MYLIKTLAFRLHLFLLVAAMGLTAPDVAPAQNNNWALQQQRMMQSQRATQQALQAQRAAQEAARLRQQQMIEQQRRQQALAAEQRAMREQQRIQRDQQQALRAQREQQKLLRDQQQAQRTQQQAVRTQRQQQEAARQTRAQQERLRTETAQRQATQAAQRQSTLTAAQQLTIRNRLQQTEQTKRLEEARRRAQQALERRKADEARTRAETTAVVAARSSGSAVTTGGSNGSGKPPKLPLAAAAAGGGASGQPPRRLGKPANDNLQAGRRQTETRSANDNLKTTYVNVATQPKTIVLSTTSGVRITADPNRTTTILGLFGRDMNRIVNDALKYPKTYDFGPKKGGFNVLNVPDGGVKLAEATKSNATQSFWNVHNVKFLDSAISRRDRIVMATRPTLGNMWKTDQSTGKKVRTTFGQEYDYLHKNGYRYNWKTSEMEYNGR